MESKNNLKSKYRIALIVAAVAPVPDVLGGGAERLVTMLIDENEIQNQIDLVVFSLYNDTAKGIADKYKNTQIFYLKTGNIFDKCYNLGVRILKKMFPKLNILKHGYYRNIAKIIKDMNLDFAIDENGYVPELFYIQQIIGKENLSAHIHWDVNPVFANIDNLYGSIIGVSNYITSSWKNNSCDNNLIGKTVYSAVDRTRFLKKLNENEKMSLRKQWRINDDDIVLIYCGRMAKQKGIKELIQAFNNLSYDNVKLLLVGGENLKNEERSKFYNELLSMPEADNNSIIFTGYVENTSLYQFYQISDIQVIPTIVEEAAGLVAIEGMLSGLPLIVTDSGGLVEYISKECALIVSRKNLIFNLTTAMKKLIEDKELRNQMSIASVNRSMLFQQEKYYNSFLDSVSTIIKKTKKKGI